MIQMHCSIGIEILVIWSLGQDFIILFAQHFDL